MQPSGCSCHYLNAFILNVSRDELWSAVRWVRPQNVSTIGRGERSARRAALSGQNKLRRNFHGTALRRPCLAATVLCPVTLLHRSISPAENHGSDREQAVTHPAQACRARRYSHAPATDIIGFASPSPWRCRRCCDRSRSYRPGMPITASLTNRNSSPSRVGVNVAFDFRIVGIGIEEHLFAADPAIAQHDPAPVLCTARAAAAGPAQKIRWYQIGGCWAEKPPSGMWTPLSLQGSRRARPSIL